MEPKELNQGDLDLADNVPISESAAKTAIRQMSEADLRWLTKAAKDLCYGDTIDAEDLLAEAMARYWSGVRQWNLSVSLRIQIRNAMKSIIFSMRKARARQRERYLEISFDALLESGSEEDIADLLPPALAPEREAKIKALYDIMKTALTDDAVACDVYEAMIAGYSPAEIQEILSITATTYASTLTKIRRRLDKAQLEG